MYCQSNTGIAVQGNPFYQIPTLQIATLDFRKATFSEGYTTFSIYNPITGLNDTFTGGSHSFSKIGSNLIPDNQFRDVKIDSFNPYGATDFKSAILLGIINSIF